MNVPTPQTTITESARSTLTDLGDLVAQLPGDAAANARGADRISEECAELSQMLRSLPSRPAEGLSGSDVQLLAALRTAWNNGEDIAETIARGCARLSWELGSTYSLLQNRSGSWEASHIRGLLEGTVGYDGEALDDNYRVTP